MRNPYLILPLMLPTAASALDVEAISKGMVNAGPWGQNPDLLPFVLGWLATIVVIAVIAKVLHLTFDTWRGWLTARKAAHLGTEQWVLDMGELLHVRPPADLKRGSAPAAWQKYRHQVKQALMDELQRSRQLAAQINQRNAS